jgi:hypothetical protein
MDALKKKLKKEMYDSSPLCSDFEKFGSTRCVAKNNRYYNLIETISVTSK